MAPEAAARMFGELVSRGPVDVGQVPERVHDLRPLQSFPLIRRSRRGRGISRSVRAGATSAIAALLSTGSGLFRDQRTDQARKQQGSDHNGLMHAFCHRSPPASV